MEWKCRKGGCNLVYLILCFFTSWSWASPLHNNSTNVTNRRAYDLQPSHLIKEYITPSIEMRPPPPPITPKPIMKSPQQQQQQKQVKPQTPGLFQHKQVQSQQSPQQQQIMTSPTNTIPTVYQPLSNQVVQPNSYSEQDWRGMQQQNYVQQLYRIPAPRQQQQQTQQTQSPQQQQQPSPFQQALPGQQTQQSSSPSPQQQQITTQGQHPQQMPHFTSNIADPSPSTEIQFLIHKPQDASIIKSTLLQSAAANNENIQFINGPQLRLKQDQKLYLPPPKKTIVYVMMAEPTVDLNVEVMESPENGGREEPEVYVVYQKPGEERRVMHHGHTGESSHTGEKPSGYGHTGEKDDYTGQPSNHQLVYEKSGKVSQFGSKLKDAVPMVMCATQQQSQPDLNSNHKN